MSEQLGIPGFSSGLASISPCGLYRWWLRRPLKRGGAQVCFILCNPSTATATQNDNTTDSCIRLGRAWGAGEIVLVNIFAYRATNPQALEWVIKHDGLVKGVGPGNGRRIVAAARKADKVVVAWGSILKPWSSERGEQVRRDLVDVELWCLGTNKDGAPRHPLYVSAKTKLMRWHGNDAHASREGSDCMWEQ